jgi:hypothetical protein
VKEDQRLDTLVAAAAKSRPRLDDVTRARVAMRIHQSLAARRGRRGRGILSSLADLADTWRGGLAILTGSAVAAVALLLWVLLGGGGDDERSSLPQPERSSLEPAAPSAVERSPAAESAAVQHIIAGSALTLYGPVGITHRDGTLVVEAQAFVLDRARSDVPQRVLYRSATIWVKQATFSADDSQGTRVSVMRGELLLRCAGSTRWVKAGESVSCEPTPRETAASPEPERLDR